MEKVDLVKLVFGRSEGGRRLLLIMCDQPVNGNKTKLNSTPLTGTTYTAIDLTENRVHTLSV